MSILIKGLDMPTKGNPITVLIYPDGVAECASQRKSGIAVPVPTPHGRLIDADALIQNEKINSFEAVFAVAEAPTIIEAEEEEE